MEGKKGFLLLMVILTTAAQLQQANYVPDEHLIVLSTNADGNAVLAVAGRDRSFSHIHPFIGSGGGGGGMQPSAACSGEERSARCRKLHTIAVPSSSSEEAAAEMETRSLIVLAPLQNAVGLMELRYEGEELLYVQSRAIPTVISPSVSCLPLEIIDIDEQTVVLCLGDSVYLALCILRRGPGQQWGGDMFDSITVSQCSTHNTFHTPITDADFPYLSNFVAYGGGEEIAFLLHGVLYSIRYGRRSTNVLSPTAGNTGIPTGIRCDRLQHVVGDGVTFHAYCTSGPALVYNTDLYSNRFLNVGSLIPFPCPSPGRSSFMVRQGEQRTAIRHNGTLSYEVPLRNFTFGQCYNDSTFLFLDRVEGTGVFQLQANPQLGMVHFISNSSRDRTFFFEGSYIMIHRRDPPEVILYSLSSLKSIVSLSHEVPLAAGAVTNLMKLQFPSSAHAPTTNTTPTPAPEPPSSVTNSSSEAGTLTEDTPAAIKPWYIHGAGGLIWFTIPLALIVLVSLFLPLICWFICKRKRDSVSIQDSKSEQVQMTQRREVPVGEVTASDSSSNSQGEVPVGDDSSSNSHSESATRESLMDGQSGDEQDDDTNTCPIAETSDDNVNRNNDSLMVVGQ